MVKFRKNLVITKGSVKEHLSKAMSKLEDYQCSVSKSLQNAAEHVDTLEDSLIASLKALELGKNSLGQTLGDRRRCSFNSEHEVAST